MDSKEFTSIRKKLKKTQKQMAELLGASIKAVHSYEQGWRSVPAYVERQLFFLLSRLYALDKGPLSCWVMKDCPDERKECCPAWEFQAGEMCWFINGTICEGTVQKNWQEKMNICQSCEVLAALK
jgi:hypothetical protein